jgi:hypothetical protein
MMSQNFCGKTLEIGVEAIILWQLRIKSRVYSISIHVEQGISTTKRTVRMCVSNICLVSKISSRGKREF